MYDRTYTLLRRFIIVFNVLIVFTGIIGIGLGLWILLDDETLIAFTKVTELEDLEPSVVELGAYVIIAGSCTAFVFGFIAIFSVYSESKCCLTFYIALIATALTLQVSSATMGFIFKKKWQTHLESQVLQLIASDFDGKINSNNSFTDILNAFQTTFECCGINNFTDFDKAIVWKKNFNGESPLIPASCCRNRHLPEECWKTPNASNSFIEKDCKETISDLLKRYEGVLISMSLTILALECMSLYLSLTFLGIVVSKEYELDH
ncbi:tetraspanin-18 [Argonauta hians]